MSLYQINNGVLTLDLHRGQARAWDSDRRFVVVLAGTQGGKTSFIPWWLWQEIRTTARAGEINDYIAGTATYDLFKLKFLPALREVFEHVLGIGRYWSGDRIIELADLDPASDTYGQFKAKRADDVMWGRIILRSAESGSGLESSTAKGAALDEAGMDAFTVETWEAVLRRLSLSRGRVLLGTTLYNLGWLKTKLHDPAVAGDRNIDLIQFDSTENPLFPREEYERAEREMPAWKFNMFYRGRYERPAGLIYDSFDETRCLIPRFAIPDSWQRYLGLDFGGVHTAGLFYAEEPGTNRLYLYREYLAGGRTAKDHTRHLLEGEPMLPICVGGSPSEGQWRDEFRAAELPVQEPDIKEVEVGIDRVYGTHKRNELYVFNDLPGYLDQKRGYSRELDQDGEPTEKIAKKSTYHYMDAERYIVGWIKRMPIQRPRRAPTVSQQE